MRGNIRIALAQRNFCVGDIARNAEIIARDILTARGEGDDLIVFPELAVCGYPPEDLLLRDDFLRAVENALADITSIVRGIDVVVGAPVRDGDALYNSAIWLRGGYAHARYDKQCLPNYDVFDEQRYFKPGADTVVVEAAGVRLGLSVCEDLWDPGFRERAERAHVDVLLNCSASPFHVGKPGQRDQVLTACARGVGAAIVYVNIVGGQDELVFDGDSRVVGSDGRMMHTAPSFGESLSRCVIRDGVAGSCSDGIVPRLDEVGSIWRALSMGLRDYVNKSGFDGVVVGVSGGIDSAVVLALAAEVFGGDKTHAFMLPSPYTSQRSIDDARILAQACGSQYTEISIDPLFQAALGQLGGAFINAPADTAGQNLQARLRGLLLMAHANKMGHLVLATGNKSEMATGYATLYGDMAGAFAPLKDVSKTRVYRLARYCNQERERIPRGIIERAPTAELAPGQLDSDVLPRYDVLDAIIETFIEGDASLHDMRKRGVAIEVAKRLESMIYSSEYKRRQSPPGVRITEKAFGKDRRYPMVSRFRSD